MMDLTRVDGIIDEYDGERSWLVMILQDIQDAFNYLPAPPCGAWRSGWGWARATSVMCRCFIVPSASKSEASM